LLGGVAPDPGAGIPLALATEVMAILEMRERRLVALELASAA